MSVLVLVKTTSLEGSFEEILGLSLFSLLVVLKLF